MEKKEEPEIIKQLGRGVYGVTYLANYHNNLVAFKKFHIHKSDIDDKLSRYSASMKFYEEVANKYPNHFVHMLDHYIVENCKFDYAAETKRDDIMNPIHKSPYCVYMISTPVLEDTLKTWYNNTIEVLYNQLDIKVLEANKLRIRNEIYSFLIQFLYMYYIMESHGWYHADSRWKNVMYLKIKDKLIDIDLDLDLDSKIKDESFTLTIPSFGKRWYLIDYDPMYSKELYGNNTYTTYGNDLQRIHKAPHMHLARIVEYLLFQPFWKPIFEHNHRIGDFSKLYKAIIANPKTSYIANLLPELNEYQTSTECAMALAIVLEPEAYMKYLELDKILNPKEFAHYAKLTKDGQYFDPEDLKFYIANITKPDVIIKHLAKKLDSSIKR